MGKLITVSERVRIESGAPRKTATATEELLADTATAGRYRVGTKDALGKVIALGEQMTYLDDFAPIVWYVYHFEEAEDADGNKREKFVNKSVHETEEAAIQAAAALAKED